MAIPNFRYFFFLEHRSSTKRNDGVCSEVIDHFPYMAAVVASICGHRLHSTLNLAKQLGKGRGSGNITVC